ncbi:hypothetical protein [Anaerococcus vaginalis]|uniref:hypothetical protein n=1 Tax=Anaerococcus vaginalis TaxID=33037 RepID=UPI002907EEF4|nr:hypothetical protein [Anaerococcus vaginalis]MDU5341285.1 hypothetical protein [Anaerococcus vaginalis]
MLDLSAKISSFRKMVWSNEKRKSEKELYDSTDFSSKTLNEIKDNLDKNYKLYIEKRKEFANARKNEKIANISQNKKTSYNKFKESLLDELIEEIKDELKNYSNSNEYKKKLARMANEIYKNLSENDKELILCVKKSDQELFDFKTEEMDDSKIGGFIIKNKDLTYQYDYSLEKKLDNYKYEIGSKFYKIISDEFEKEMEDKNDSNN